MTRKAKKMLIILGTVGSLVCIVGVWFWWSMGEPLYKFGMARNEKNLRGSLSPPPQPAGADLWLVEKDIELHHFVHGSGTPLLFIHGGPGIPVRDVPEGIELLGDSYACHFYDHRGCGRSTKPFDRFDSPKFYANMLKLNQTLGIAAQIADIERIRRILGQDKLTLIGHSFGGFIAALYAAEFPEHVAALILVAPADLIVFPQKHGNLFDVVRDKLPSDMRSEYGDFEKEYLSFSDVFTKSESDLVALGQRFARYYEVASGQSTDLTTQSDLEIGGWLTTATFLGLGKRHDYTDAMQAIDVPSLVIHGGRDLMPQSASERYAELIRNADMQVIPSGGHFVMNDSPESFAALAKSFLASVHAGH